jgi:hypothetical protein
MYDDDVTARRTLASPLNRNLSPVETEAMVENVAWSAKGAGARLFGWNQRPDPRVRQRNDPFSVGHWCGGVLGVAILDALRLLEGHWERWSIASRE